MNKTVVFTFCFSLLSIVHLYASELNNDSGNLKKIDTYFELAKKYKDVNRYDSSIHYINEGIALCKKARNNQKLARFYDLMGAIWEAFGDGSKSLEYELKAVKIYQQEKDQNNLARINNNIGVAYFNLHLYTNAIKYYLESEASLKTLDNTRLKAIVLSNIGEAYLKLNNIDTAILFENNSLRLNNNQYLDIKAYALGILGLVYLEKLDFVQSKAYINQALSIFRQLGDGYALSEYYYHLGRVYGTEAKYDSSLYFLNQSLTNAHSIKAKLWQKEAYGEMANILKAQKKFEKALECTNLSNILKDSILNENTSKRITQLNALYESENKEAQIALLKQENLIHEKEMEKQKLISYIITAGIFISSLFALALYNTNRKKQKAFQALAQKNTEITKQKEEILGQSVKLEIHARRLESEKNKSDRLLRNILPEEIAAELKEKGEAKPRLYNQATLLFADFVNFTHFAENNSPQEITRKLDSFFLNFDLICEQHKLEKIKTVGDCYMAAGGLPVPNSTNAHDAIKAAIEFIKITKESGWQIRIGIHTGPVVAGVIGINKFAYDVWGDTVNLASRLESTSENNRINISKETYLLIKDQFKCTYRGMITAKNKGDIEMYFIEVP